jgi:medium-chain acyl-[acyl-carrier-protein] hydrolase
LFCFPYAGSGASVFRPWSLQVASPIEIYGIQLPGREYRLKEQPITDIKVLVEALMSALLPFLDRPFAIFGHSVGALIGFEVTRQLQRQSWPMPQRLFVSARQAPHWALSGKILHQLSDSALKEELRTYGGTPELVLQNHELMSLFLPVLRADLTINETYHYEVGKLLNCPISAFAGLQDTKVSIASVEAWAEHTTQAFHLRLFPGNHFFIKEETTALPKLLH